jgi:hypothetical protein
LSQIHLRRFGALAVAAAISGLVLAVGVPSVGTAAVSTASACATEQPTAGAPATDQPMEICESFDKPSYRSSDVIKLAVTVINIGKATPGVPGVKITLTGPFNGFPYQTTDTVTATTDSAGNFEFANLPGGKYAEKITDTPYGLAVRSPAVNGIVTVDGAPGQTNEQYPMAPLSSVLKATAKFDQPSYHVGELSHLKITLSNTSSSPIGNIQPSCNPSRSGHDVTGIGKDRQALRNPGVTLAPGQTKVVDVSQVVVAGSATTGKFDADCFFGPNAATGNVDGDPEATASATARSAPNPLAGTARLRLIDDDHNGAPVDASVALLDPASQSPIVDREIVELVLQSLCEM